MPPSENSRRGATRFASPRPLSPRQRPTAPRPEMWADSAPMRARAWANAPCSPVARSAMFAAHQRRRDVPFGHFQMVCRGLALSRRVMPHAVRSPALRGCHDHRCRRSGRLAFLIARGVINNIRADNGPHGVFYDPQGFDGRSPRSGIRRIGRDIQEICVWKLFFWPGLQS